MLIESTLKDYCNQVDSAQAAPGGGSVCGLCGALAISLIRMYAHLSIHKQAFSKLEEKHQYVFIKRFSALEVKKEELLHIVDADKEAYEGLLNAMRSMKQNDCEETRKALKEASDEAMRVPYHCMELALDALKLTYDMVLYGNRMVLSDLIIGAIYLEATLRSSAYNVSANLSSLDEKSVKAWQNEMDTLQKEANYLLEQIEQNVNARLKSECR